MAKREIRDKLLKWSKSAGGILFPEEIEHLAEVGERRNSSYLEDRIFSADGILSLLKIPVGKSRDQGEIAFVLDNLIVDVGRESIALMISDTGGAHSAKGVRDLGKAAVGRGSANGTINPQPSDTALVSESTAVTPVGAPTDSGVTRKNLTYTQPLPGPPFLSNLWTFQIASNEMNSAPFNVINEAGIYSLNNTSLFSYRTFEDQTKTAGFTFEFRWSHLF